MLTKSQRIVILFGAWVFLSLLILAVLNNIDYEYLFVLCLIGFLVIVELSGPYVSRPKWRARLNWAMAIGVVVFITIVVQKMLTIVRIRLF